MDDTNKELLKIEIHGIDVELDMRRHAHYEEVAIITRLEEQRAELVARLNSRLFDD